MGLRISGDTTTCMQCGATWDTNDPNPPAHCLRTYEAYYNGVSMGKFKVNSKPEAILAVLAAHRYRTGPLLEIDAISAELVTI